MSWNRSNTEAPATSRRKTPSKAVFWIACGILLLAIAGVIAYFIFGRDLASETKAVAAEKKTQSLPSVTPAVQATVAETNAVAKPRKALDYAALAAQGKMVVTNSAGEEIVLPRSRRLERPRPKHAIFAHWSENRIAALIAAEPGTRFFGTQNYDEKFKQDFMKSCEVPIVISKDDDEYTQTLKKQMIETKIDLRNRMSDGEDICKIMADSRKELQRLGIVKQQMQDMIRKQISENAASEGDVEDYVNAANKMLEAKGIAPIQMTPILKRTLMRTIQTENTTVSEGKNNE